MKEKLKQYASRNSNFWQFPYYSGPDAASSCSKCLAWKTWASLLLVFRYFAKYPRSLLDSIYEISINRNVFFSNGKDVLWTSENLHVIYWILILTEGQETNHFLLILFPSFPDFVVNKERICLLWVCFIHSWFFWDASSRGSRT